MRIIAGRFRSRRLPAAPPKGVRPTSDRLRETLFNILGDRVIESVFLDAYAGVGAIGIEALSRGARRVYFVDRAAGSASAIRRNLDALAIEDCPVLHMELERALRRLVEDGACFDVVFLDPPYDRADLYGRDLDRLSSLPLVAPGGVVVAEHATRLELPASVGRLRAVKTRRQGDSTLTFFESEDE